MAKIRLSIIGLLLAFVSMAQAQSVIAVEIVQHAPLAVVADNVQVEIPVGGITLGSGVSISGGDGHYTYSWTNANGDVIGTEPTIDIYNAGNYYLAVTDGSTCTVSVQFTATASTGIDAVQHNAFTLTTDGGTLNVRSPKPLSSVRLVATDGHLVASVKPSANATHATLSTVSLPSGVYLVGCVFADGTELVKKVTLQ